MPTYDYGCQECGKNFEMQASFAEYEQGLKVKCPDCESTHASRTITPPTLLVRSHKGEEAPQGGCFGPKIRPGGCK